MAAERQSSPEALRSYAERSLSLAHGEKTEDELLQRIWNLAGDVVGLVEQLEAVQDALGKIAATPCYLDVLVGEADRRMLSLGDGDCASCYAALALLASFPATTSDPFTGKPGPEDISMYVEPDPATGGPHNSSPSPVPEDEWNSDCWKGYENCRCRRDAHVPASIPGPPPLDFDIEDEVGNVIVPRGTPHSASNDPHPPASSPETPCSICRSYGHFTHNHPEGYVNPMFGALDPANSHCPACNGATIPGGAVAHTCDPATGRMFSVEITGDGSGVALPELEDSVGVEPIPRIAGPELPGVSPQDSSPASEPKS